MRNFKKLIAVATIIGSLGVVGIAGASYATGTTPAEIAAKVTGKTVEAVKAERATGTTYGAIAEKAGKLEEFKTESLVLKKEMLEQRVTDGNMTREQADAMFKSLETNQATCDGTSSAKLGQKSGMGFGGGQHNGGGMGMGGGLNQEL